MSSCDETFSEIYFDLRVGLLSLSLAFCFCAVVDLDLRGRACAALPWHRDYRSQAYIFSICLRKDSHHAFRLAVRLRLFRFFWMTHLPLQRLQAADESYSFYQR